MQFFNYVGVIIVLYSSFFYGDIVFFKGNLHQSQYTEKLKSIVEFLGPKLSMEELTTIWEMQVDKNPVQVALYYSHIMYAINYKLPIYCPNQIENVHGILAAAASRCTSHHLDHLFQLISQVCTRSSTCTSVMEHDWIDCFLQSWEMASDRYREKLLELIGKIGKDDRQGKTASKVSFIRP